MLTFLSLVTSVKDYIEIINKMVETDLAFSVQNYMDWGAICTYIVLSTKNFFWDLISFQWLSNLPNLPVLIPDIGSALVSEISILKNHYGNAYTWFEKPFLYGDAHLFLSCLEKLMIGIINSLFLFLPTSTAHIISLRRFVIQGVEAGYLAGLGTLAGNLFWIASFVFGWRFLVLPWVSYDLFRYFIGILLISKYIWDSYNDKKTILNEISRKKIFLLNFLLAFTEQSSLFPFLGNLSIGSDSTAIENFPAQNLTEFWALHVFYLLGLFLGGFSLLQLSCWFWENAAFRFYSWTISSFGFMSRLSSNSVNLVFLYLTIVCASSNLTYFGFDYLVTKGVGFVANDRIIEQKGLMEVSFLGTKASDRNTRRNIGHRSRRERWKRRVRRYRTFDASLYNQGIYDLFTIEDLNYGFDRFWLRRKIRNLRLRFRLFPGPWMKSLKQMLSKSKLESLASPRLEFFRNLKEEAYHPIFHEKSGEKLLVKNPSYLTKEGFYFQKNQKLEKKLLTSQSAVLRKWVRKVDLRKKASELALQIAKSEGTSTPISKDSMAESIQSKRWKKIFSTIQRQNAEAKKTSVFIHQILSNKGQSTPNSEVLLQSRKNLAYEKHLSIKDQRVLKYKSFLKEDNPSLSQKINSKNQEPQLNEMKANETRFNSVGLPFLHPLNFYLKNEEAFEKKLQFYGAKLYRNFGIENNATYYRIMSQKFFYYYKATPRWESTMKGATLRMARRKSSRTPQRIKKDDSLSDLQKEQSLEDLPISESSNGIQKPTHMYNILGKRATRYRHQIYKDVLQHWYYSPFNRLLLKLDIDQFIRRQPSSYFLRKEEESLLQLRRYLLSDYYESLRSYNLMQHYRSMKSNIGGTKSFASRFYNQQFYGTFKKIRHLFAVTPISSENSILKFDQNLYNEYSNNKKGSIFNDSFVHEELLAQDSFGSNPYQNSDSLQDSLTTSLKDLKEVLSKTETFRQKQIEKYIADENYWELTKFLWKGQKIRGVEPASNPTSFYNQEKEVLYNEAEKAEIENRQKQELDNFLQKSKFQKELWVALLQKHQNRLYDRQSLREYLSYRVDKSEKHKQKKQKQLKERLERLQNWVLKRQNFTQNSPFKSSEQREISTSLSQAMKEALQKQKNIQWSKYRIGHKHVFNSTTLNKLTQKFREKLVRSNLVEDEVTKRIQKSFRYIHDFPQTTLEKAKQTPLKWFYFPVKYRLLSLKQRLMENEEKVPSSFFSKIGSSFTKLFRKKSKKDLQSWNSKQRFLLKRKQTRKGWKRLKRKEKRATPTILRNSLSTSIQGFGNEELRMKKDQKDPWNFENWTSDFQTKRSRKRGSRRMRPRQPILKRTLSDKFKRQFRLLKRYGKKIETEKQEVFQILKGERYYPFKSFELQTPKSKRSRIRENRYWRKHKKPKYAQNRRKLRKRKRYAISKIRNLNKTAYQNEARSQIQRWWWQTFLPKIQAQTNVLLTQNQSQDISKKLSNLSNEEILKRNLQKPKLSEEAQLEIGDYDYKPFSIPQALSPNRKSLDETVISNEKRTDFNLIQKLTQNALISPSPERSTEDFGGNTSFSIHPTPFYMGWDTSLRKFVVTNRVLARSYAGYERFASKDSALTFNSGFENLESKRLLEFEAFPLKGMNVATTLYWQIPFTTYDPDQFFTLGRDGFAPINWRRFEFQYAKQSIKPLLVQKVTLHQSSQANPKWLSKMETKIFSGKNGQKFTPSNDLVKQMARRIQKRNKRVKGHSRFPSSYPSGRLANEVLPVHYIYVFYKRHRLPRDRYIARKLRSVEDGPLESSKIGALTDLTLRRRLKTRRKYHRKSIFKEKTRIQRRAWRQDAFDQKSAFRRPGSVILNESNESLLLAKTQDRNDLSKDNDKSKAENIRIRQLKSRSLRQRIRPISRYKPKAGGYVWPGDYLRFENVASPSYQVLDIFEKRQEKAIKNQKTQEFRTEEEIPITRKVDEDPEIQIQQWQLQPKNYLIQKHNIKVLKKRLVQSQKQHKLQDKIKEISSFLTQ